MECSKKRLEELERRVQHLELVAHEPVDWSNKIESLQGAYNRLYDLFKSEIMRNNNE